MGEVHEEVMELLGFERRHGLSCLQILRAHQEEGGELNVDLEMKGKLLELRAQEELDHMTIDQRAELLQQNAKKVNVLRNLPSEARQQYLQRLQEGEKLEIAKS